VAARTVIGGSLRFLKVGGGQEIAIFRQKTANFRRKRYARFGAQRFSFAYKFPQNGGLPAPNFVFSVENVWTKIFPDRLNLREGPGPAQKDVTDLRHIITIG